MHTFSAHDPTDRFGQPLDAAWREHLFIERHGRADAVEVSKDECDALNDIKLQQLRAAINRGLAELERGACTDYEVEDLPRLAARIKAAGRERLAKK